jgi:ABC-type sulfate transport system permease component
MRTLHDVGEPLIAAGVSIEIAFSHAPAGTVIGPFTVVLPFTVRTESARVESREPTPCPAWI